MKRTFSLLIILVVTTASGFAAEGKWTPLQVTELGGPWLKKQGLELAPSRLWDPTRGTGLLSAAVEIGTCSGGFITADGLVITNHHCLFSAVQEHSTASRDLITNGFVANGLGAELPGTGLRVSVPRRFTDVTAKITAAVPAGADDTARKQAIEGARKKMLESCESAGNGIRCSVAEFDGGVSYALIEAIDLQDVRLVYAPPRSIGEFGGEVDNWTWPRHTGDFSIGRAYVGPDGKPAKYSPNNVPYRPEFFFPIAKSAIKPGDFVMLLGYPGTTYRALTAAEMIERRELYFTRRREVFGEWIRILEEATKDDAEGAVRVADTLKTLQNRAKNAEGQLAGFSRWQIVERKLDEENAVAKWAESQPAHREAVVARGELEKLVDEQKRTWEHDWLLGALPSGSGFSRSSPAGPKLLSLGVLVGHTSVERQRPEATRDPETADRNMARIRDRSAREQSNYFAPADQKMLASWVMRSLALPEGQRMKSVQRAFRSSDVEKKIAAMYATTRLNDEAERLEMLEETPAQLRSRNDELLDFALDVEQDMSEWLERKARWEGAIARLRPVWRRAVAAHAGRPIAPDANSTLRVSFAHIKAYSPRDAVVYQPQTTLAGVVEKHTGQDPFNVPSFLLEAARQRKKSAWEDPALHDVPVDFLTDGDTTGGSSGSPVVNGRGELVGVNFDRVWENVANDFGYLPEVGRTIGVDVRYLMWVLEQTPGSETLRKQLSR